MGLDAQGVAAGDKHALRLDDLLALDARRLKRLYDGASVPRLDAIGGDLRGRMLCPVVLPSGWGSLAVAWAGTDSFPWRGKSFSPVAAGDGRGINRVFSERVKLFPFETFVGPSRAGDYDAVQLNYDLPENPFFIRAIKDEIRELSSGLFLGQAYLHTRKRDHLVLYFALASRV